MDTYKKLLIQQYPQELLSAEEAIKKYEEQKQISSCCEKGCNFCCRQAIVVTSFEVETIKKHLLKPININKIFTIRKNVVRTCKQLLENKIHANSLMTASDINEIRNIQRRYFELKIMCPFNINGACSIYQYRPITCLTYKNYGNKQECENKINPKTSIYFEDIEKQIRANIFISTGYMSKNMELLPYAALGFLT